MTKYISSTINHFILSIGLLIMVVPIWIIFALSVGGSLFGILGILMAIPMAAIIGVLARFVFYIIFEKL